MSHAPDGQGAPPVRMDGRLRFDHDVATDIALEAPAAAWTCLLGPSGIGKSTLLRMIADLPSGGDFDGQILAGDGPSGAGQIAYMAQSDMLAPWFDVYRNVTVGPALRGEPVDRDRAEALIARVGLSGHAHKTPPALSGGMRQRAALARTLIEDRPVVLLDEPFSALDARTRAEMQELAFELLAGRTVLLVTHDPAEAARLGHRIYLFTERGLAETAVPAGAPIRGYDDPDVLRAQSALLAELRAA